MALIRNAQAGMLARDAVVLDLGDLARQGRHILEVARQQAEQILTEARAERDRIVAGAAEKGHAKGLAEGLAKGLQEGEAKGQAAAIVEQRARLEELGAAWSEALDGFAAKREELLLQAQRDVLDLALVIGAKVTKRIVQGDPGVVVSQAAAVLELISRPTAMQIVINPEDRGVLERVLPDLTARSSRVRHVEIVEDATISRGGVMARSRMAGGATGGSAAGGNAGGGEIDATIETQIERIVEALVPGRDGALGESGGVAGGMGGVAS